MNYAQIAVIGCFGAIGGFCLAAYIYGKELERTKQDNEYKDSYIAHMRTRFESIQYDQRRDKR